MPILPDFTIGLFGDVRGGHENPELAMFDAGDQAGDQSHPDTRTGFVTLGLQREFKVYRISFGPHQQFTDGVATPVSAGAGDLQSCDARFQPKPDVGREVLELSWIRREVFMYPFQYPQVTLVGKLLRPAADLHGTWRLQRQVDPAPHPRLPFLGATGPQRVTVQDGINPTSRHLVRSQHGEMCPVVLETLVQGGSPDCHQFLVGTQPGRSRYQQSTKTDIAPMPRLLEQENRRNPAPALRAVMGVLEHGTQQKVAPAGSVVKFPPRSAVVAVVGKVPGGGVEMIRPVHLASRGVKHHQFHAPTPHTPREPETTLISDGNEFSYRVVTSVLGDPALIDAVQHQIGPWQVIEGDFFPLRDGPALKLSHGPRVSPFKSESRSSRSSSS